MKNVLFIGLGQAGGRIIDAAYKRNFDVFAINCAHNDLEYLQIPEENKILISEGVDGTGKNRDVANAIMKQNLKDILYKLSDAITKADFIVVAASLSGGFGSGSAPVLLKALDVFDKYTAGIFILPSDRESYRAKQNAVESFAEITRVKSSSFNIFIDNQKLDRIFPYKSIREKYDIANDTLLSNMSDIFSKTSEYSHVKSFDKQDLINILSERGLCVCEHLEFPSVEFEKADIREELKKTMEQSPVFVSSLEKALRVGVVFNIEKGYDKFINIDVIKEVFRGAYDITYSFYESTSGKSSIYILANGMPLPVERIQEIENILLGSENNVVNTIDLVRNQQFDIQKKMDNFLNRKKVSVNKETALDKTILSRIEKVDM